MWINTLTCFSAGLLQISGDVEGNRALTEPKHYI